ncbi:MAG TPA: phosphoribosylanthranilate isomerase [Hanamia sp.]|nr:phosphoribosylanthranilate isomerase [Hanamia sp.]
MKIKVCGITDLAQLQELNEIGIDYAGLIFYAPSPRSILKKLAAEEVKNLGLSLQKVGVFVNETAEQIMKQVELFGLEVVQLHGDETPAFCSQISDHVKVIKAFRINEKHADIDWLVKEYDEVCDYYLFDKASSVLYGGTGEKFKWEVLKTATIGKPFFLSGGISINEVDALKKFEHPFFYGIDINSRFEKEPGIKDLNLVKEFVRKIKPFPIEPLK